jgi:serine/threonine protein kinase/tetratricopeptide (TPR) repeat protein
MSDDQGGGGGFNPDAPTGGIPARPEEPGPGSSEAIMGRPSPLGHGTRIGPYALLEKLGEGGMGEVWRAERREPVHRVVAVKLIRAELSSSSAFTRFEIEREVLERLDHTNIAKLLDAGETEDGRPYFVMDYVRGTHITEFCRNNDLTLEERLQLVVQVSEAVQHAHLRGVIHRDLKPSNILVAWEGNQAVPKIIDFGVARATDPTLHAALKSSELGRIIGTVEYMSPEQARMSAEEIDLRTDVYALGVVLYELLTGDLPFPSRQLREAAEEEMLRIIREERPKPPTWLMPRRGGTTGSTTTSGGERRTSGGERRTSPGERRTSGTRRLTRMDREDLDWIVLKCLEKRRDARYSSAGELAGDLVRFLKGEPIPRPVGWFDGLRRFYDQHKPQMASAAALAAVLILGAALSMVMWRRAEASDARGRELASSLLEEYHEQVATLPGSIAARDSLVTLGAAHLQAMLRRAGGDPPLLLDVADGYDRLGEIEGGLKTPHRGDVEQAESNFLLARGLREDARRKRPDDPRALVGLAESAGHLSEVARQRERIDRSIALAEEGLGYLDLLVGPDAEGEAARIERANLLVILANMLGRTGDPSRDERRLALLREAEAISEALVGSTPTDEGRNSRARALHTLGEFYLDSDPPRPQQAARFLDQAVEIRVFLFNERPTNAVWRRDLAGSQLRAGQAAAAIGEFERANELLAAARHHFGFLVEADPEDVESRRRLAQTLETMAIGSDRPRGPARVELLEPAFHLAEGVVASGSGDVNEDRRMLAIITRSLGRNYRFSVEDGMDEAEALRLLDRSATMAAQAREIFGGLLREDPGHPEWLEQTSRSAVDEVYALNAMGQLGGDERRLARRWRTLDRAAGETLEWLQRDSGLDLDAESVAPHATRLAQCRGSCGQWIARLESASGGEE